MFDEIEEDIVEDLEGDVDADGDDKDKGNEKEAKKTSRSQSEVEEERQLNGNLYAKKLLQCPCVRNEIY